MGGLRPSAGRNPLGGPVIHLDVIGSTNDLARELAIAGAPAGTVVLAEEQTAGRGRQGRSWVAPPGRALTLSIVVRTSDEALAMLPLTVAVAVCEACERVATRWSAAVKWPNDVWIGERKVAGILIEARPQDRWAVVGIGLNVETTAEELPAELRETATSLRIATGGEVGREAALQALLEALAGRSSRTSRRRCWRRTASAMRSTAAGSSGPPARSGSPARRRVWTRTATSSCSRPTASAGRSRPARCI